MPNITVRLLNARRIPMRGNKYRLVGVVYKDVRRRFDDGELIQTSPVVREDGRFVLTEFITYEVESWAMK